MTVYDRMLLAVFSLAIAFLSVMGFLATLGMTWSLGWVATLMERPVLLTLVNLFFLGASLRFLYLGLRRRYTGGTLVYPGAAGEIRVALSAVENLVRKVAAGVAGVRDIKAEVERTRDAKLRILVRATVSPDANIPEVSNQLHRVISGYVKDVVGVTVEEIRIYVVNIADGPRRGRVE
ncbi:MAG: alkaline shock response membrane anchor protein AmaP [Bacillota bacterium]